MALTARAHKRLPHFADSVAVKSFAEYMEPENRGEYTTSGVRDDLLLLVSLLLFSLQGKNPSARVIKQERCMESPWRHATCVDLHA